MKKLAWLLILISMLGLLSCNNLPDKTNEQISAEKRTGICEINYAQGFKIEYFADFKLITIKDPWQGADGIEFRYALAENIDSLPQLPDDVVKIKIPIEKIACLSTTHIAFIDALNKTTSICAISGHKYACNQWIRKAIDENKIVDVGYDNSLNYELIAGIKPDLVTTYGIGSQVATYNQRMNELGIKTVIIAEYLENHPLGKLEWVKLVAAFYNMDDFANDYFNSIEKQYNELLAITKKAESKPSVLFGLPWKEVWYVPGGNSYLAKLVEDAGGDYIWKKDESRESLTFNFETIFLKANNSQIWLNTGAVNNIKEIIEMDERFKKFKPITNAKIYNNNAITNEYGGIDYWESGIVNPHIILKDMIAIFHPELLKEYQLVYYKKIE